jgi:hypothetical protein
MACLAACAHVQAVRRPHDAFGVAAAVLAAIVFALAGCSEDGEPVFRADSGAYAAGSDSGQAQGHADASAGTSPSDDAASPDVGTSAVVQDASPPETKMDASASAADAATSAADATRSTADGTAATVADYNKPGPYGAATRLLNQGMGTVSGGSSALIPTDNTNDPSAFTLYYPKGGRADETFPLLTFGNGTFCSPTFYDEFIGHVVSYGYIVIAPNTSNTGTGVEMLKGVDWVLAQNQQAGSPISGKVDVEHIGAFGHSQGGAGTCRAGADPRIDAIATLSGASSVNEIQCPAFFVTTGGEAGSSPDARIQETLSQASKPSMYGITVGGNHDEYTDKADEGITAFIGLTSNDGVQSRAAVTAWFDWQLKGMQEVGELFRQKPCKFCNRENLQRLDLDGF